MKRLWLPTLLSVGSFCFGIGGEPVRAQLAMPALEKPTVDQSLIGLKKDESSSNAKAEIANDATEWIRLSRRDQSPVSLDVAVTSYVHPETKVSVDLVGAIHIGDKKYYAELNKLFDQYDVLLYELVAPEGTVIPHGGKREGKEHPIAMIQGMAKSALGLESQLEQIDYTKSHFVRADLTPEQMAEKMAARGETAITIALDTLADVMKRQNKAGASSQDSVRKAPDISIMDLFGSNKKLKRIMAEQFVDNGAIDESMGPALNRLLIVDRNGAAIECLKREMGRGKKKIGIFYGAAHMPDLERHLTENLRYNKSEQTWLKAWDLR